MCRVPSPSAPDKPLHKTPSSVYYVPRKHAEDVNPSGRSQRTRRYFPAEIVRAGHSPRRAQVPRPLARLSCTATAPTAANALSLARAQTKSTRRPVFVRKQNIFGLYVQARPVHAAARAPPPIRRPSHPPATSCCPVRPLPRPLCSESSTDSRSCSVCSTPSCASPSLSSSPVDSGVRRYVPLFCGLFAMSPPPQLRYVLALGFVVRLSAHRRAQRVLDVAAVELYSRPLPARRYVTPLCLTHTCSLLIIHTCQRRSQTVDLAGQTLRRSRRGRVAAGRPGECMVLCRGERVLTCERMPTRAAESVRQDRRGTRKSERNEERKRARSVHRRVAALCAYIRMRCGPSCYLCPSRE